MKGAPTPNRIYSEPILTCTSSTEFREWLEANHRQPDGIWLRISKKNARERLITYAEALDEALCYGWIDGQIRGYDDSSSLQRFCPRRSKSKWSKINRENVERLIGEDRMQAAGQIAIDEAKKDGRWEAAYDSASTSTIPEDFLHELAKNPTAEAFFKTLNSANRYAIAYRLQTAIKPEIRQKRMETILAMLARGETFH